MSTGFYLLIFLFLLRYNIGNLWTKNKAGKGSGSLALYRKPTNEKSPQAWVQERKAIAARQLQRIPDLISSLFSKNDWTDFLLLVSRLPSYSYLNLLIIHDKYPSASVLAGFSVWQQQMGSGSDQKVLRPDAVRNGIDLVIPFTNVIKDGNCELTWYSVLVFDIKQINVQDIIDIPSPYTADGLHLMFLRDAVSAVLGTEHHRRVIFDPEQEVLKISGTTGRILDQAVTVRRDVREEEALFWLTEALCRLSAESTPLSGRTQRFLQECVHFCLCGIWKIQHPGILPGSPFVVPENERDLFLELLQRTVFDLYQKVAGFYLGLRQEALDPEEDLM